MGACYSVKATLPFKNEKVKETAREAIINLVLEGENIADSWKERMKRSKNDSLDKILDEHFHLKKTDDNVYSGDFDCCYTFECALQELFSLLAPFMNNLKDAVYINPDNCWYYYSFENGQLIDGECSED